MQQFPDEAVGAGAHWQVVHAIDLAGIKLVQTQDFTLRSRSGDRIELDLKLQQDMTDPDAAAAGMPSPGSSWIGTGKVVIDLHKLTSTATMEANTTSVINMPAQQGGQPQTMKMISQLRMSTAPAQD